MTSKASPSQPNLTALDGGKVVPIRRPDERRASLAEISDEALLAACGVGESAALGALYDRHHEAMYRLVSRMLRSERAEIDDLVQTTFLEAWKSAKGYSGKGSVKSFLYGIAANTVRHHVRSAKRRREALADLPEPMHGATPDVAASHAQQVQRLGVAIERLPHALREVYVLCDLEDVPGVEAARILDVRAGTLWRRLHDARKLLREALDGGAA